MLTPDDFFEKENNYALESGYVFYRDKLVSQYFPEVTDYGIILEKKTDIIEEYIFLVNIASERIERAINLKLIVKEDYDLDSKSYSLLCKTIINIGGEIDKKRRFKYLVTKYLEKTLIKAQKEGEIIKFAIGWNLIKINNTKQYEYLPIIGDYVDEEHNGYNEKFILYSLNQIDGFNDKEVIKDNFIDQIKSLEYFFNDENNWLLFLTTIHAMSGLCDFVSIGKMDCRRRISTAVSYDNNKKSYAMKMVNLFCNVSNKDEKNLNTLTKGIGALSIALVKNTNLKLVRDMPLIIYKNSYDSTKFSICTDIVRKIEREQDRNEFLNSPVYFSDRPFRSQKILNISYKDTLPNTDNKLRQARKCIQKLLYLYLNYMSLVYTPLKTSKYDKIKYQISNFPIHNSFINKFKDHSLSKSIEEKDIDNSTYTHEQLTTYESLNFAAYSFYCFLSYLKNQDDYRNERHIIFELQERFDRGRIDKLLTRLGVIKREKDIKYNTYFSEFINYLLRKGDSEYFNTKRSARNKNQCLLRADKDKWLELFREYCRDNDIYIPNLINKSKVLQELVDAGIVVKPRKNAFSEKCFSITNGNRVNALVINKNALISNENTQIQNENIQIINKNNQKLNEYVQILNKNTQISNEYAQLMNKYAHTKIINDDNQSINKNSKKRIIKIDGPR